MKKACLVVSEFYKNNRIFDLNDSISNRDNCMYGNYVMKEEFKKYGYDLSTQDINPIEKSDIIIYNEMPEELPKKEYINKSVLLIFESSLIIPRNWNKTLHKYFKIIFTWSPDLIDNKKYFHHCFSIKPPEKDYFKKFKEKQKFCVLIAGNKISFKKNELYSERLKTILWFEKYHPEDLDLYGFGWDTGYLKRIFWIKDLNRITRKIFSILDKIPLFSNIFRKKITIYRGKIDNKFETLSNYKFCICYENAKDIRGYITEKILDCIAVGTVPVYWGAPIEDLSEFEGCYIDRRKFKTHEEMYNYLKNITEEEYNKYQENMKRVISKNLNYRFDSGKLAKEITKKIMSIMNNNEKSNSLI